MNSLSALYLFEQARQRGIDLEVISFGTTVITARRDGDNRVRIMSRRVRVGVSSLPVDHLQAAVALCGQLFGIEFHAQDNVLATALTNINPVAHAPLGLFNWTRIERAEN